MARAFLVASGVWVGLVSGVVAYAQPEVAAGNVVVTVGGDAVPAVATRESCVANSKLPGPAETALSRRDFSSAESLFREALTKDAKDEGAHEGLLRTLIAQDKVVEAAKAAAAWAAAAPASSMAMTALGEVRLRQGNPGEALLLFQKAVRTNRCNARAYYGVAKVEELAGMYATGRWLIEQAYRLHPTDNSIYLTWISTRQREERLKLLVDYAEYSDQINDEDRAKLKTRLAKESLYHSTDCRMTAESPREATIPMGAVMDGISRFVSWGLDVKFNGKQRRLQIDTGASGITLTRTAAMFMGIKREDSTVSWGVGDKGQVETSVAHVASVKIGGLEFINCPVEILENSSVLDSEGIIGGDVFYKSLLTLDFPKHELRLAPLPDRMGSNAVLRITSDVGVEDADDEIHDLYVAPEMAQWNRVFRRGSDLLMRTRIVETKRVKDAAAWKEKLFLLDTGAGANLISTQAAAEVTRVSRSWSTAVRGVSGKVNDVFDAGRFTLEFAGIRLDSPSMTAIDFTKISHEDGVEVSGLIGAPALFQVVMHIDYRDNLVWCEYPPKK